MSLRDALIASSPALLGLGAQLSGRSPVGLSLGLAEMQQKQEDAQKREAIKGLLAQSGIGGVQRGLLEQLPIDQQAPAILNFMQQMEAQRRAGGAASAAAARAAQEQQAYADFMAQLGSGPAFQTQSAYNTGVAADFIAPSAPLSFGTPTAAPQAASGGLSFGSAATPAPVAPAAPTDAYTGARATYERLLRMPPPPPGTGARKAYDDAIEFYERQVKAFAPEAPDLSEAEQEIARLESIGIPRDVAIRIKEGVFQTVRDPLTGQAQVIDLATGRVVWGASAPDAPASVPQTSQPPQAGELSFGPAFADSPNAFGLEGFGRRVANTVADVIPGATTPFPETQQTQADFGILRENLLNDMASAYNRQPPSWLLQEIRNLTPAAGNPLEGAGGAQTKLRSIGRMLESELRSTEAALSRRQSPEGRAELEARQASLQGSIRRIQTVLQSFGGVELRPEVADRLKAYE